MLFNLLHGDVLLRLALRSEFLLVLWFGLVCGIGLSLGRLWLRSSLAILAMLLVASVAIILAQHQNVWFGWLTFAGVQVPVAWLCSWVGRQTTAQPHAAEEDVPILFQTQNGNAAPMSQAAETIMDTSRFSPLIARKPVEGASTPRRVNEVLNSAPPISGHTLLQCIGSGSYGE